MGLMVVMMMGWLVVIVASVSTDILQAVEIRDGTVVRVTPWFRALATMLWTVVVLAE